MYKRQDQEQISILTARLDKVKRGLEEKHIDMMLVSKEENKNYLSMFYSTAFEIIITQEKNYLLTDFRYIEAARGLEPLYEVVQVTAEYGLYEFLAEKKPMALGLELSCVTVNVYNKITSRLEKCGIIKADGIVAVSYTHLDVYKRQV